MASPFSNTLSVWHGLFLRETLDRFFGSRAAWAWLLIEPMLHLALFGAYYTSRAGRSPTGAPVLEWLLCGMLLFFLFRRTAVQTQHSVDCNKAFFAFRQVKPLDAALVRGSVEAFSMGIISTIVAAIALLLGYSLIPKDPLLVIGVCAAVWFLGVGYGMITAVIMRLIPESGHIFMIFMLPLYFLSGVIIPLNSFPPRYVHYFMYNPVAHAIELVRQGFFYPYHGVETSLEYLSVWSAGLFLGGLILFKLFNKRLLER